MNTIKLNDIEEEVINILRKSRNKSKDNFNDTNSIINQDNNYKHLYEDDRQFSDLEPWQNKANEDNQQHNIINNKKVYKQQNSTDVTQDRWAVELNGNMWEKKSVNGNTCAPSSGDFVNNLNELPDDLYNVENDVAISFLYNINYSEAKQLNDNNIVKHLNIKNGTEIKNLKQDKNVSGRDKKNIKFNKSENDDIKNNGSKIKLNVIDNSYNASGENSVESLSGNYSESIAHHLSDYEKECPENCLDCNSKISVQVLNSSCSESDISDEESDCIEESIIKEKLNRINNPREVDDFNDLAEQIICESYPSVQDTANERKQLLIYADRLSEAIEYNILMRNTLYDLEHALLKLIERTVSPEVVTKSKKIINTPYRKRKFYLKYLSPYFKDKRGISFAPYVKEDILSEKDGYGSENFKKLYHSMYEPQIYDVYNAIKQYFEENRHEGETTIKKYKREGRKGRRKTNYENEYTEIDFDSMESQFVQFLRAYKSLDPLYIFDAEIDWFQISSNPCLQGMSSKECQKIWHMILKPLIQLGAWSGEESDKVLDIAIKYEYQNWDKIAEELGTGRTEYLCFCHVMSKPIQGITQNTGAWTPKEDEFLLTLVEKCRYGKSIMWGRIFYYIDDRTVTQILNRWYRLNPALKRGKFNHNEDSMLMYCVEQFGRDFGKIATLFGDRSPIQLRERYFAIKDLTDKTKLGEWSVEEDRLLLNLVDEYGESKWAEIAAEFPGRNRTQIRHRYASVLKRWLANPSFQLESLKRHKRTTHIQSVERVKQIDTSEEKLRLLVQSKLKTGKVTLKRDKRAGKQPTIGDDSS